MSQSLGIQPNIFGKSHFVSHGIQGSNVIAVQTDQRNSDHVIITSSNNIKLYEPNSRTVLESWVCKSLVTPAGGCVTSASGIFYCPVGANLLLQWSSNDTDLDKLDQIKFTSNIHSLEAVNGSVYVVFVGGYVEEITQAIFRKKTKRPLLFPAVHAIKEVEISDNTVLIVTQVKGKKDGAHVVKYTVGCSSSSEAALYSLTREGSSLSGVGLLNHFSVITLWSNGELCRSTVYSEARTAEGKLLPLRLRTIGSCRHSIDCSRPARIIRTSDVHVAVLGLDISKDGGRIELWDIDLLWTIARRNFKLYQPQLRCWVTSPGQEGTTIVLHEKQELTVVPFHKMPLRGAAAVVTQQPASVEGSYDYEIKTNWCKKVEPSCPTTPDFPPSKRLDSNTPSVSDLHKKHNLRSMSEQYCCEVLVKEAVDRNSLVLASEIIFLYQSALPEHCIVSLMSLIFAADESQLLRAVKCHYKHTPLSLDTIINQSKKSSNKFTPMTPQSKTPNKNSKGSSAKKIRSSSKKKKGDWSKSNGHNANGYASPKLNGHCDAMEVDTESVGEGDKLWSVGWMLLFPLLRVPLSCDVMTKQLHLLPFRDAMSLVAHLGRIMNNYNSVAAAVNATFTASFGRMSNGAVPTQGSGVCVPSLCAVSLWLRMLCDAHKQTIILEQQLQGTLPISLAMPSDTLIEETENIIELANLVELTLRKPGGRDIKLHNPDDLYSIERIALPW